MYIHCKNYLVELASQCGTLVSGFIKLVSIHHEENLNIINILLLTVPSGFIG